jgi:hypothetical protein
MKVEQISVFLENKAGRLAEVTKVLGEGAINIRALSLADTTDFGILRLIVDQYDKAREILKQHAFTVGKTEVVAIEVPDRPGLGAANPVRFRCQRGIYVRLCSAQRQECRHHLPLRQPGKGHRTAAAAGCAHLQRRGSVPTVGVARPAA